MERVFVFTVWEGGESLEYASVLPPEMLSPEGFTPNESFARALQHVVRPNQAR